LADYLLDTMILRYWYNTDCDENPKVRARVETVRQPDPQTKHIPRLLISAITIGEIEYGHRRSSPPDPSVQTKYMSFIRENCPEYLEVDSHVGECYGVLKAWLFNTCPPWNKLGKAKRLKELVYPPSGEALGVDENDLWIAAQAMANDLVLVTHDFRHHFGKLLCHFKSTLQIDVDDWAQ